MRNLAEFIGPDPLPEKEFEVADVVDHRGHGRGRKYRVKWSDGDFTWEPRKNLMDKKEDGTEVVLEALSRYLRRNQALNRGVAVEV